ncbi:MAG: hypothetical protein U5N53_05905 [Mycobacterium sp.]|nr:hypothetical protein [Mycobacterium sp.]
MDFSLNEEQKMMIDTIRRFIAEELNPLEDELENYGFPAPRQGTGHSQQGQRAGLVCVKHAHRAWAVVACPTLDRIVCEEQFGHTTDYPDPPRLWQRVRATAALQR